MNPSVSGPRGVRCALALVFAIVAAALANPAGAEQYVVIRPGVATYPRSLQLSHNGHVLATYETGGIWSYTICTPDGSWEDYAPPTGIRLLKYTISDWGIAAKADHNGQTPMEVWSAPFGQPLSQVASGTMNGSLDGFDRGLNLNGAGVIAWSGRDDTDRPIHKIYRSEPGGSPSLVTGPEVVSLTDSSPVIVDSQGRLLASMTVSGPSGDHWSLYRYTYGAGWTDLAFGLLNGTRSNRWAVNSRDEIAFSAYTGTHSAGPHWLHLYSDVAGTAMILDNTSSTGNDRLVSISLADNGDLLVTRTGYAATDPYEVLLRKEGTSWTNLADKLPSGRTFASYPIVGMNPAGDVLIESINTASSRFEYYRLHDDQLTLLLDSQGDVTYPRLAPDGRMYFFIRDASSYSLAVTPEPGSLSVLALGGLALIRRRKRHAFA